MKILWKMTILKGIAFFFTVTGIAGIVGAVETGTSPVNAVIVFLIGAVAMEAYVKVEDVNLEEKSYGKERSMSGFEKEELRIRVKGMTLEEQAVTAGQLKDEVLWNELRQRFSDRSARLENINETISQPDMKIGSATVESYRT